MAKLLLSDGARRPELATKEDYLAYVDALNDSGERITYRPDGTADVHVD